MSNSQMNVDPINGNKITKEISKLKLANRKLKHKNRQLKEVNNKLKVCNINLGVMNDQTALKQDHLAQLDRMKNIGFLSSSVVHEISNPNSFILTNSIILNDMWRDILPVLNRYYKEKGDFSIGGAPFSSVQETFPLIISRIIHGSQRINSIVGKLKTFSRKNSLKKNLCSINFIVEGAIEFVKHLLYRSTYNFTATYSKDIPEIFANSLELQQVVINLLTNACQALLNRDQKISVRTGYDENLNKLFIEVIDEGAGILKKHLNKVKTPFFTTKDVSIGTGLGLFISDNIINNHNGTLHFKSNGKKGTVAIVEIPVNKGG